MVSKRLTLYSESNFPEKMGHVVYPDGLLSVRIWSTLAHFQGSGICRDGRD